LVIVFNHGKRILFVLLVVYIGVSMLGVIKNNDEQTNIVLKNFGKLSPFLTNIKRLIKL